MMRYKTKFNLLRDEVVKANNELVDNKLFETYVGEEQQGTIMITNAIVKALVKTIKFYEQAYHKLDCENKELKDNLEESEENEVNEISVLYNTKVDEIRQLKEELKYQENQNDKLTNANLEQFLTIMERNNEIDALKYMLDRKDND